MKIDIAKKDPVDRKIVIGIGVLVAGFLAAISMFPYYTAGTTTITVTDKDRIVERDRDSRYLVFTDEETFENTDCLMRWKFNSSDVQSELKPGNTYKVLVYGWRVPFLSWYRNIVRVEKN